MKIKRLVGRTVLGILGLFLLIVVVLAITGVPKPPSITTRNVPRVTWGAGITNAAVLRELGGLLEADGWLSDSSKVWIGVGVGPRKKRAVLAKAGEQGAAVHEIPPTARNLIGSPDIDHPIVAYLLDEGGSERYRLFSWVPGSQPVALTSNPERLELCCMNNSGSLVAFSRNNKENGLSDVLIANPRDPSSVRVVISGLKGEASPTEWSPDGTRLLVLQNLSFNSGRAMIFDASRNAITRLVPEWGDAVNITGGTWSKDGKKVFLTSDAGSDFTRPFELDLDTKKVRPLNTDPTHEAVDIHRVQGTDDLIVLFNEDGRTKLYLLDPLQNIRKPLPAPNGDYISMALHPHQPQIVETVSQADGRFSAHVIDLRNERIEQWAIGEAPARAPVPSAENLYYPTFDSVDGKPREINLIFKKPTSEFPPPWPVIINLHGGPAAQWRPQWDPIDALFQRLGIAILEPNVRGSTGFGREFTTLDDGQKREDAVRDVGALLDWIKTRPDLDGSRVGVLGASYGGYLSLATMTHYSDRLRCGVDLFGVSDLANQVEASSQEMFVDMQRAEYGDERDPKTRAFLDSISPINHVENINVPILIFQGANDVRVKPVQSRKMVARLEALGRNVRYIEANNEGHGVDMPLNQLYLGSAIVDFYREFLFRHQGTRPAQMNQANTINKAGNPMAKSGREDDMQRVLHRAMSVIALLIVALVSLSAFASQSTTVASSTDPQVPVTRKIVSTEEELPQFSYPVTGTAQALLMADDPTFNAFASKVNDDLETILRNYDIKDKSVLLHLLSHKVDLQTLSGDDRNALQTCEQMRSLFDQPALKVMGMFNDLTFLNTRIATGLSGGQAFQAEYEKRFRAQVETLPWDVVAERITNRKAKFEKLTAEYVMSQVQTEIEPSITKNRALDFNLATRLIYWRGELLTEVPAAPDRA